MTILGFTIGIILMLPFVVGMYYIGKREGYDAGNRDAWNNANKVLVPLHHKLNQLIFDMKGLQ